MDHKKILSGTLCKKDDSWFLKTDDRSISIGSPSQIDPAFENQKVSIISARGDAAGKPGSPVGCITCTINNSQQITAH